MQVANIPSGCSMRFLSGFPYDGDSNSLMLERLRLELKGPLPENGGYVRIWAAVLCSQQMKAKALLEEAGFKVLVETKSGHPEKPAGKACNGGTLYFMWYEKPKSILQERRNAH